MITLDIMQQAFALREGLCLGIVTGLFYDLFRVVRRRISFLSHVLDLLFWLIITIMIFVWSQQAWGGYIRLYGVVFIGIGSILYFLTFTPLILWLGFKFADFIQFLWGVLWLPVTLILCLEKKIKKFAKNLFLFWLKWYKIEDMTRGLERAIETQQSINKTERGEEKDAHYTRRHTDTNRHHSHRDLSSGSTAQRSGRHSNHPEGEGPTGFGSASYGGSQYENGKRS